MPAWILLCKWNVHVVVNQNDQADLACKIEHPIERRILQARDFTRTFADTNSL
jgi:hypothetical protein